MDSMPPLWENAAWVLVGIAGFIGGWFFWKVSAKWAWNEERYWLEDG